MDALTALFRGSADLFDKKILKLLLAPLALLFLLFGLETYLLIEGIYPWLDAVLPYADTWKGESLRMIVGVGSLALLFLFNLFAGLSLIGSLFADKILRKVNEKRYGVAMEGNATAFSSLLFGFRALGKFLLFTLLVLPLALVPVIGPVVFLVPAYFYFRKTLLYDAASALWPRERVAEVLASRRWSLGAVALAAFLLTPIPGINFLAYAFGFLAAGNFLLALRRGER